MPRHDDPNLYRRRLRDALRTAREAQHLTQRQAAEDLDWSMSKLVRIEAGTVNVSTTDLKALLQLYAIEDETRVGNLLEIARNTRRSPWYSKYQDVIGASFAEFLGYERSAATIKAFTQLIIPGLVQTDDYARAILEIRRVTRIDERVELRMERQELLDQEDCPEIFYVIDEAALHRQVGGAATMRRQLRRLKEAMDHPKISVEIIPFSAGAHPSMSSSFTVLEFADWDEDVLYQETTQGSVTTRENQDQVAEYIERFDLLRAMSLGGQDAIDLVDRLLDDLTTAHQTNKQE
ncbi:MAG: helix-turn-helix transcriptional regulator [Streptosporangiaceae bacterium]|jgi:transcriptional regulator with XRE-family HTH domain